MKIKSTLLPILIILLCLGIGWYLMSSKPQPKRGQLIQASPVVMAQKVKQGEVDLIIKALGIVKPVQEVQLRPRVTGTVIKLNENLNPGGFVAQDEILLELDPTDYELEVRRKQSAVAKAKADVELEMGQQRVAKAELNQLKKTMPTVGARNDPSLALREPHLAQVQAALASSQADLDNAKINLERTKLKAPFNGLVTSRSTSLGSQASTSDVLANLIGTDKYWIEAVIPLDRLNEISLHPDKATVSIRTSAGGLRNGRFERVTGTLDVSSRMGQILISVDDPLLLKTDNTEKSPLIINDQVQVEINTGKLDDIIILPRSALRGGNMVWLVEDGKLRIRPVQSVWRDTEHVYVKTGLKNSDMVITSDLAAPIEGMGLRVAGAKSSEAPQ